MPPARVSCAGFHAGQGWLLHSSTTYMALEGRHYAHTMVAKLTGQNTQITCTEPTVDRHSIGRECCSTRCLHTTAVRPTITGLETLNEVVLPAGTNSRENSCLFIIVKQFHVPVLTVNANCTLSLSALPNLPPPNLHPCTTHKP